MKTRNSRTLHLAQQLLSNPHTYHRSARQLHNILSSESPHDIDLFVLLLSYYSLMCSNRKLFTGKDLAIVLKRLVANEQKVGGPYLDATRTIDAGVNIVAALILQQYTSLPTGLVKYLKQLNPTRIKSNYLEQKQLEVFFSKLTLKAQRPLSNPQKSLQYQRMIEPVHALIATAPTSLNKSLRSVVASVIRADKNEEILRIPQLFYTSLKAHPRKDIPSLPMLCMANFLVWMAGTIYDGLMDDAKPAITHLPAANWALRSSVTIYNEMDINATLVNRIFDMVDAANTWESAHAKCAVTDTHILITSLPRYTTRRKLAEKSLVHALGPLLVATLIDASAEQLRLLESGFIHYLIARQLSDDLHDWREDFMNGQITSVVASLLHGIHVEVGSYDLLTLLEHMKQYYWNTAAIDQSKILLSHIRAARYHFKKSALMDTSGEFFSLLNSLEESAKQSIADVQMQKDFIAEYRLFTRGA